MAIINIVATRKYPSSPLILGGNRAHSDDVQNVNWRTGNNYRPGVIAAMQDLQTNWGSDEYGRNTFIYRIGHGMTDGRIDKPYLGYRYKEWFGFRHSGSVSYGEYDDIMYGPNEAEEMGAIPIMVANYGTDTMENVADFVGYLNQATNPERAANNSARYNNSSLPNNGRYDVKYFELGNEISWDQERGHDCFAASPIEYAKRAAQYAQAMRQKSDIPIKVSFVSNTSWNMTGNDGWGGYSTYNLIRDLLINSKVDGVQQLDALSIHAYPSYPIMTGGEAKKGKAKEKMGMSTYFEKTHLSEIRRAIRDNSKNPDGSFKNVDIWNTEFFSHWYDSRDQNFAGTMYGVDVQMFAVRQGIPICVPFTMWHKQLPDQLFYQGDPANKTSWYRWMKLWSKNWGDDIVDASVSGSPTFNTGATVSVTADKLTVCSSRTPVGHASPKLYVMVLNRSNDEDVAFDLNITDFNASPTAAITVHEMRATGDWETGGWDAFTNPDTSTTTTDRSFMCKRASMMLLILPGQTSTTPPAPTVTSVTPASGPVGTSVTIQGANFSATKASNVVKFNGVQATVNYASADGTELGVMVPNGATDGTVTVTVGGQTGTSSAAFDVTASPAPSMPTITSFTPSSGYPDQFVTVTGTNFSPTPSQNTVKFNGSPATVTAAAADGTQLTVIIPDGATDGAITVEVEGSVATSPTAFDVTTRPAPTISSIAPSSGYPGESVTITGTNFGLSPESNLVQFFDGVNATVTYASSDGTKLVATVPQGATNGAISVTVNGQKITSASSFTVTAPPAAVVGAGSPVRQTVLSGRVGDDGRANFLQADSGLQVNIAATQVPVTLVFAAGFRPEGPQDFIGRIMADGALSFSNLPALTTAYLYVERNPSTGVLTAGYTDIKPVYSIREPENPVVGMHYFDIAKGKMFVCTGVSAGGPVLTNVATQAGAMSGGDAATGPRQDAFDGSSSTAWAASQTGSATYEVAYIGCDFQGVSRLIKKIYIDQADYPNRLADFRFEVTDNPDLGWTSVQSFTTQGSAAVEPSITTPVAGKYARLVAHSNPPTGQNWRIVELRFMAEVEQPGSVVWQEVQRVFLGEASTDEASVRSVTTYALQGRYLSGRIDVSGLDNLSLRHDLGTDAAQVRVGLSKAQGGALELQAAMNQMLYPASLSFDIPSDYVEVDVMVSRVF